MMLTRHCHLLLVVLVGSLPLLSAAHELRGAPLDQNQRALNWFEETMDLIFGGGTNDAAAEEEDTPAAVTTAEEEEEEEAGGNWFTDTVDWIFGDSDESNATDVEGNSSNWISDTISDTVSWIFGDGDDNNDANNSTDEVSAIVEDIFDTQDGSDPLGEALNATVGSDNPLLAFLASLLNQEGSENPIQDFVNESFNLTANPLFDWITDLFETTANSTTVSDFVTNLVDGSVMPLQSLVNEWFGGETLAVKELNCPTRTNNNNATNNDNVDISPKQAIPSCAHNFNGDEGVWICRTLYNPVNGTPTNQTLCANPERTFVTDKCGACNNKYPRPCQCKCNRDGTNDGVLVSLINFFGQEEEQCVHAGWAIAAADRYEITCVTC